MSEVGIDISAARPKLLTTDAVRPIRDDIDQRVRALLAELTADLSRGGAR